MGGALADGEDDKGRAVSATGSLPMAASSSALTAPRSGRTVRLSLSLGQERIDIVSPSGKAELTVILTEAGPKLVFESADIQIVTPKQLAVQCQSFEVKATEEVRLVGAATSIEARSGDVKIEANDRVRLMGEQIRLNCDNPDQVPPWMQRELAAELVSTIMPSLVPRRDQTGDASLAVDGVVPPANEDP